MSKKKFFDFSDTTVFIFTRNRPRYLINLVKYWSLTNIRILVCDGSDNPIKISELTKNPNVIKYDSKSLSDRFEFASQAINTKYSFLQGDDDLIPFQSIASAKEFLAQNSGVQGIWREPFEFNSSFLYPDLGERSYRAFNNSDYDETARALAYLRRSYDMHFHGFFVSDPFKRALRSTSYSSNIREDEWLIFFPIMFEVAMSVNCRTLYFEEFNYLKRRIEDVGVFSRKTRKLESNIQEEIHLSWNEDSIQSLWKEFLPQWLDNIKIPTFEKDSVRIALLEYGRNKQRKRASSASNQPNIPVKLSERFRRYLTHFSLLYFAARVMYRTYLEIKYYYRDNRLRWRQLENQYEYYPVPKFVDVFQMYPRG